MLGIIHEQQICVLQDKDQDQRCDHDKHELFDILKSERPAHKHHILILREDIRFHHRRHKRQDHGHAQRLQHRSDTDHKKQKHNLPLLLLIEYCS